MAKGRNWLVGALSAAALLLLVACGASKESSASGGGGTQAADENGKSAIVKVVESDLGRIVADAKGRTLYVFTPDRDGSSTCYDKCAATWPPLTIKGAQPSGDGVEAAKLGTTERKDGAEQVTFAGRPLYYFGPDGAPGDTKGQGVNDIWFVVSPVGEPIRTAAVRASQPQSGAPATSQSSGY